MAAAFVQDIAAEGENVASISYVFGVNVAAGNFLALQVASYKAGAPPNTAPTGGGSWSTTTAPTPQNDTNAHLFYCDNGTGGATTVVYNIGAGTYASGNASEFSGVGLAPIDVQSSNTNAGSNTPTSGTTATTTQADGLVLAHVAIASVPVAGGVSLDVPATTGFTNAYVDQIATPAADTNAISSDYKIVSATGTQSAAWGTTAASYAWVAKIATFKASAGASSRTYAPSGGLAFAGAPAQLHGRVMVPAGGLALAGAPSQLHGRVVVPSGGFTFGGQPEQLHGRVTVPTGGVTFGGTAPMVGPGETKKLMGLIGVGK